MVKAVIDGQEIEVESGITILEAAKKLDIHIPTLCHNDALTQYGSCRICTVAMRREGWDEDWFKLVTSCNYPIRETTYVETKSERVLNGRRMIVELLLARCPQVKVLQDLAKEMGIEKPRFSLKDKTCILCGLCTRACEDAVGLSAIGMMGRGVEREVSTPFCELSDECIGCGTCAVVCPTGAIKLDTNIYPVTDADMQEIEDRFLEGTRDEDLGVFSELTAGKASIQGQDGGIATALLLSGMEKGLFDAAVVVARENGYQARYIIAETADDIKKAAGTKYLRVPMVSRIEEALESGKRKIAVVGTPCEVRAIRKMQQYGELEKRYPGTEFTVLGLFCFESFDYGTLKEETSKILGVDLDKAEKTQISKGKYIVTIDGEDHACKVKELDRAISPGCPYCCDFVSKLADISVGSVGSEDGCSTIIVRSPKGKELLDAIEFEKVDVSKEAVAKLVGFKQNTCNASHAQL